MEHVNAEILRAIADGKKVQYRKFHPLGWEPFQNADTVQCWELLTGGSIEWRIAPETIKIGDFEVPEPVQEPLTYGQEYFVPDVITGSPRRRTWARDSEDVHALKSNLIHLESWSAAFHAKALIEVSKGWWK